MQIPSHPASSIPLPPSAAPSASPSAPGPAASPRPSSPLGTPAAHPASAQHLLQMLAGPLGMAPEEVSAQWAQQGSLGSVADGAGMAREDLLQTVIDVVRQGSTRESLSMREQLRMTLMATDIIDGPVRRSVSYTV